MISLSQPLTTTGMGIKWWGAVAGIADNLGGMLTSVVIHAWHSSMPNFMSILPRLVAGDFLMHRPPA
jgi:hypothetical protein